MSAITEDSILLAYDSLGDPDSMRRLFMIETGACHSCGHRKNMVELSKEVGVNRFVLIRFLGGGEPRLRNHLKIARWIFERRSNRARR